MVSASMAVQHAKWLSTPPEPVAASGGVAERAADVDLLAQRPQRLQPPGSGAHRHGDRRSRGRSSRVYLPPDANCLLSVADHCLRSRDYVNLIVDRQAAAAPVARHRGGPDALPPGASRWDWAEHRGDGDDPDIVLACAGDIPTMEAVAAAGLLRGRPRAAGAVRQRRRPHDAVPAPTTTPTACSPGASTSCSARTARGLRFPRVRPGDAPAPPRPGDTGRFHVRGFKEEGTTTTPFDMVVLNRMSRYHLVRRGAAPRPRVPAGADALPTTARDARPPPTLHPRAPRGHARDPRLDVAG